MFRKIRQQFAVALIGCASLSTASDAIASDGSELKSTRSYYATTVMIPMRDGVRLSANILTPGHGQPAPTVLSITPYGRHGAHRLAATFASQGLTWIGVDTRGRGDSEGEFRMFYSDLKDTVDVVRWITEQPFSNGKVSMWGSSYGGFNQWMAAAYQAPGLTSITPGAAVYPGWDFPMANNIGYPYSSKWTGFTKGRMSNRGLFADPVFWNEAFSDVLKQGIPFKDIDRFVGFDSDLFDEWVAHPSFDDYWAGINPTREQMSSIDMPILSTTGYYDGAQEGSMRYYKEHIAAAAASARRKHYLVLGPYDHTGVVFPQPTVGGLDVPDSGGLNMIEFHMQWFFWTMAGGPKPEFLKDNVMYYVMGEGANEWRSASSLEAIPVEEVSFTLSWKSDNAPVSVRNAGRLSENHTGPTHATYVFDPADVSKAHLGGWFEGAFALYDKDVDAIDGEALVFDTEPFEDGIEIIGQPSFKSYISIDTPDADFQLRIYEIRPDGSSVYLSETRARARYRNSLAEEAFVSSREPIQYTFDDFTFAARRLAPGSRLRLVFGAPNSIHIQRNYNAAKPVAEQTPADALTSTVQLLLAGESGARLVLPLREVEAD